MADETLKLEAIKSWLLANGIGCFALNDGLVAHKNKGAHTVFSSQCYFINSIDGDGVSIKGLWPASNEYLPQIGSFDQPQTKIIKLSEPNSLEAILKLII